jgi:hypothetical protein
MMLLLYHYLLLLTAIYCYLLPYNYVNLAGKDHIILD